LSWLAPLSLVFLAGCGQQASDRQGESQQKGRATKIEVSSVADTKDRGAGVTVRVIDEDEFGQVLKGHQGKVVLVDFWALWCGPCVKLFPHTVELHQKYPDQELAVISVSFDNPQERQRVLEFLAARGATFDNFISKYGIGSKSFEAFEIGGNVPYFKLYDRSGKLQKTFGDAQQSIEPTDIDRAVEELLGEV